MIREAGCVPVERDTLYNEVERATPPPRSREEALLPIL
jgi:2-iminoacetate synthase ThiH